MIWSFIFMLYINKMLFTSPLWSIFAHQSTQTIFVPVSTWLTNWFLIPFKRTHCYIKVSMKHCVLYIRMNIKMKNDHEWHIFPHLSARHHSHASIDRGLVNFMNGVTLIIVFFSFFLWTNMKVKKNYLRSLIFGNYMLLLPILLRLLKANRYTLMYIIFQFYRWLNWFPVKLGNLISCLFVYESYYVNNDFWFIFLEIFFC